MPSKVTKKIRERVWEDMLTADLNCRYWGYLYRRYDGYERNSKIFLAITSSSTVASWTFWTQIDVLWKTLSALSALIAISTPYMNWQNSMEKTFELRSGWLEAKYMYEKLWRGIEARVIDQDAVEASIEEVVKKLKPLGEKASSFHKDMKLAEKCQRETLQNRGLL